MSQISRGPASRVRVVIVGGGMIGNVHRRAALLNGAEVIGVVEQDDERAAATAARWGVDSHYDSVEKALAAGPGRPAHLHPQRDPCPVREAGPRGRGERDLREAALPRC